MFKVLKIISLLVEKKYILHMKNWLNQIIIPMLFASNIIINFNLFTVSKSLQSRR